VPANEAIRHPDTKTSATAIAGQLVTQPSRVVAVASTTQLARRGFAELLGTALLLMAVVGSGIAAQSLSPSDTGLELLEHAAATGAALVAIILGVGSVSRVVSCADAVFGGLSRVHLMVYVAAQAVGAALGVVIANLMFALAAATARSAVRSFRAARQLPRAHPCKKLGIATCVPAA
jgi:glycerol uptake facilitator-like aquaporin